MAGKKSNPNRVKGGRRAWKKRKNKGGIYKRKSREEFKKASKIAAKTFINHFTKSAVGTVETMYHVGKGFNYKKKYKRMLNKK